MKQLDSASLKRVVRELQESPALVAWIFDSREENREKLEGVTSSEEMLRFQGGNRELNQLLAKVPAD